MIRVARLGQQKVHAWLPAGDVSALSAEAEGRGEPLSAVIREAVAEHLARGAEGRVLPALDRTLAARDDRLALVLRQMVRDAMREAMGHQN